MATAKKPAPASKQSGKKPIKGSVYTPANASKELPKSFYQQGKGKKKGKDIPDL